MPPFIALFVLAQTAPDNVSGSSILVTLAALVGAISGIGAIAVGYRNSKQAATKDYVQTNLDSLAAVNERLEQENERLRQRADQARLRAEQDRERTAVLESQLADVRKECDECLNRIQQLENNP